MDKSWPPSEGVIEGIHDRIDGSALNSLDDGKKVRMFNALEESFYIYPVNPSVYTVISIKEGENSQYSISFFDQAICECYDYIFHAHDGQWCKHILRVWSEIQIGELPRPGTDPSQWLASKIEQSLVRSNSDSLGKEAQIELRKALKQIQTNPDDETFYNATIVWRKFRASKPNSD